MAAERPPAVPHEHAWNLNAGLHERVNVSDELRQKLGSEPTGIRNTKSGLSMVPPRPAVPGTPRTPLDHWREPNPSIDPKRYTVEVHGSPNGVSFRGQELSAKELAEIIKGAPGYKPGAPVRLLSCNTGADLPDGSPNFAQQLSKELGVEVLAPKTNAWVDNFGNMYASESRAKLDPNGPEGVQATFDELGQWASFHPDGTQAVHDSPYPPGHEPEWVRHGAQAANAEQRGLFDRWSKKNKADDLDEDWATRYPGTHSPPQQQGFPPQQPQHGQPAHLPQEWRLPQGQQAPGGPQPGQFQQCPPQQGQFQQGAPQQGASQSAQFQQGPTQQPGPYQQGAPQPGQPQQGQFQQGQFQQGQFQQGQFQQGASQSAQFQQGPAQQPGPYQQGAPQPGQPQQGQFQPGQFQPGAPQPAQFQQGPAQQPGPYQQGAPQPGQPQPGQFQQGQFQQGQSQQGSYQQQQGAPQPGQAQPRAPQQGQYQPGPAQRGQVQQGAPPASQPLRQQPPAGQSSPAPAQQRPDMPRPAQQPPIPAGNAPHGAQRPPLQQQPAAAPNPPAQSAPDKSRPAAAAPQPPVAQQAPNVPQQTTPLTRLSGQQRTDMSGPGEPPRAPRPAVPPVDVSGPRLDRPSGQHGVPPAGVSDPPKAAGPAQPLDVSGPRKTSTEVESPAPSRSGVGDSAAEHADQPRPPQTADREARADATASRPDQPAESRRNDFDPEPSKSGPGLSVRESWARMDVAPTHTLSHHSGDEIPGASSDNPSKSRSDFDGAAATGEPPVRSRIEDLLGGSDDSPSGPATHAPDLGTHAPDVAPHAPDMHPYDPVADMHAPAAERPDALEAVGDQSPSFRATEADRQAYQERIERRLRGATFEESVAKLRAEYPEMAHLPDVEAVGLRRYVGEDAMSLNHALRSMDKMDLEYLAPEIKVLRSALNQMPDYAGSAAYRNISVDPQDLDALLERYKPGSDVVENAFTSASKDAPLDQFGKVDGKHRVQFVIEEPRYAKDLEFMNPDEREILWPDGNRFEVSKQFFDPESGEWKIHLIDRGRE
ncbi:hypothetical protein OU415_06095 [Saccharopolyspora sp. WRP15-2]|uniref:ADP ribosyltransferase domain-containing protein n=1 Tax=Saccharopolyspora oryzae TaxID=2997343 RepID=A0ABT4UTF8_9PSEU|nr:hypothetical protein [Saccharopolyspora oryzae]MDA3624996.1 hypothetical protein [Saccharopolyspora oryzae]